MSSPAVAIVVTICGLAVVLDDGRPVFFVQTRLGRGRAPFELVKLRTMRAGEATRVGRWLRTTGLDEVPQLIHVLRGQMDLVGPRPLTPDDAERLETYDGDFASRFAVNPGITGLVQVLGGRGPRHCSRLERLYARRRSVGRDLGLIGLSAAINVWGRHRVRTWIDAMRGAAA